MTSYLFYKYLICKTYTIQILCLGSKKNTFFTVYVYIMWGTTFQNSRHTLRIFTKYFCPVAKLHLTLRNPVNYYSMTGFPVLHCLPELSQLMSISQWCHPTISSSVTPCFSWLQPFPASGSFSMSWIFASGSQSIGTSASVLPMNIQSWFPLELIGLISLLFKGLSRVFTNTIVQRT